MTAEVPVLVIAYNRPDQIRGLIQSLRLARPSRILFAVDGPAPNSNDVSLVQEVLEEIALLDWDCDISVKHDGTHRGLRRSVEGAVSWAFEQTDRIIVLEDDTRPTVEFFKFMNHCLETFARDQTIGHVSGYNKVPPGALTFPKNLFRASRYPESCAWGTWKRAWALYSSDLSEWVQQPAQEIGSFTVSSLAAHCWKINIRDARDEVISTWAYRWTLSLWANSLNCVTPNVNLVSSTGAKFGTHTRTKPTWRELPTSRLIGFPAIESFYPDKDNKADLWLERNVMRATRLGIIRRFMESVGLRFIARVVKRNLG